MRIAIVHGNDGSDVRIGKVCRSLSRSAFDVTFIGWDRRPSSPNDVDLGATSKLVMKRATRHGRASIVGQIFFLVHVLNSIWKAQPRVVCAINEDQAFFLLPFKRILFRNLVCDIFDTFYDRHSHRNFLFRGMAKAVTWLGRTFSDRLIVTDENRLKRLGIFQKKAIVIQNVPEDPGSELATRFPEGNLRIFVGGSLSEPRGVNQILAASEGSDVEIVSVGWVYDRDAEKFIQNERVDYRGVVTLAKSLEYAAECDAIFSFYSPSSKNNLNASPNKIYDALSVGRPVIINSEIKIANWVAENQLGFVCDYSDLESLRDIILQLESKRTGLPDFARRSRSLFESGYNWEAMEHLLFDFYQDLSSK